MGKQRIWVLDSIWNRLDKGVRQLDVECEKPITSINPKLETISRVIENQYSPLDGKPRHFYMSGIQFWTEDVNQLLGTRSVQV